MKFPILLPNIFNHPFTYKSDLKLKIGDFVEVSFGKAKKMGVVWNNFEKKSDKNFKIKKIIRKLKIPNLKKETPFEFTMKSVLAAQESLVSKIKQNEINSIDAIKQKKNEEVRYTINKDFTDQVALAFLNRKLNNQILKETISQREYPELINPFFL